MRTPTTHQSPPLHRPVHTLETTAFRIEAIASEHLGRIRDTGRDDFGNPFEVRVDDEGGAPLRCCLRPSEPGERVALIAYRALATPGPYAEVGPVFVHGRACPGYQTPEQFPPGYRDRAPMIFRPYDAGGAMVYSALAMVAASESERATAAMFADPEIAVIHARNVYAGCFMYAIHRSGREGASSPASERQLDLGDGAGRGTDRGLDG